MKFIKKYNALLALTLGAISLSSCDTIFSNPGDYLNGGGEVEETPTETESENKDTVSETIGETDYSGSDIPEEAIVLSNLTDGYDITESGSYVITGENVGQIDIKKAATDVTLYLYNATLTRTDGKKVIKSDNNGLTITLIGENYVSNTGEGDDVDDKNAIDVQGGELVINGTGSLTVNSVNHGIRANSIIVNEATLDITSVKDGLHAEITDYDDLTEAPTPSYDDGGYVYLNDANINITSTDDGIQADTFIYSLGGTTLNILANEGAPNTITETSSDNASGKGIKAGQIDWGADDTDLDWDGYCIYIADSTITIDSNDDAIHSNGEILIESGTFVLDSGDDAIHSDDLLQISGGDITINKCYEGIESAKVEISGGNIDITTNEDGINAADGTTTTIGGWNSSSYNENCHIIISGGYVAVNCIGNEGDGIDSNGTMLISGGELYIAGSSNNSDAALDSDGGILINGGYVFAVGQLGMVETPATNSEQYCVSFAKNSSISANTTLYLTDSEGEIIMYFVTPRSCQSIILSCPEFTKGESYSIYGGDTKLATFTINSTITSVSSSGSIDNPGGNPGGNQPGDGTPGFGDRGGNNGGR